MFKKLWIATLFAAGGFALCDCQAGTPPKPDTSKFALTETVSVFGNAYVTNNRGGVPTINVDGISDWNDPESGISLFFRVNDAGALNVALYGRAIAAGTKLRVAVNGKPFTVGVDNTAADTIRVGQVELAGAGYVRVDLKALKFQGNAGEYSAILVGGPAVGKGIVAIPAESPENWAYWGRRGPSVHMKYTKPQEDIRWFYNEVTVPEGNDVLHSYFMSNGFSGGYMGMQVNGTDPANRRILFSVWSAFTTDNPKEIPEEYRVVKLRQGEGVTVGEFGNEGSGGQSYMTYPWKAGKTYKFLTEVRPDGATRTIFTGYFCGDDGQWRLIASFMRPDPRSTTETHYMGMHSFLENFGVAGGWMERRVFFGNQWARTTGGEWIELTEGTFTYDNTARSGMRFDYDGGLQDGKFYLRNCGFFDDNQTYNAKFVRPALGAAPDIDFTALENIPSAGK